MPFRPEVVIFMDSTANKRLKTYKENPFFYSSRFIFVLSAFVYLFWFFDLSVYGIMLILVLCGVLLALCRDLSPVVPLFFVFVQIIGQNPDNLVSLYSLYFYIAGICVLVVGLVIHFIRFKPFRNYGKIKGFAVGVCFAALAIILGGISVTGREALPVVLIVIFGLVSCGAVFFFIPTLGRDSSRRLTKTVMNAVIASSVIAIAQLVTLLIQSGDPVGAVASKYSLNAGYAHPNYLANIIARSIPVAIWLSVSNKRYSFLWLFFAYICGVSILLTSSRATLLVAVIVSIVCVIYYFPKLDYKLNWICTFCILLGITMTGAGLLSDKLSALFPNIFKGLNSNGRIDLWNLGIERFLKKPIFGVGLDFDLGGRTELNPTNSPYTPFWYHNTVVQILCCTGIFGLLAFIPYFYHQYRTMLIGKKPATISLLFVIVTIQAISLLDVFFFTPQEFLQMIIITVAGIKALPEDKGNSHIYDLIKFIKLKKHKEV